MAFFAIFPAKVINKFGHTANPSCLKMVVRNQLQPDVFFCAVAVSIAGGYTFSFMQIFRIWPSPMMGAWAS